VDSNVTTSIVEFCGNPRTHNQQTPPRLDSQGAWDLWLNLENLDATLRSFLNLGGVPESVKKKHSHFGPGFFFGDRD
jgi:hypothetical protein